MLINKIVEQLLRDNPKTRSSDKELLIAFWDSQGLCLTPAQREQFRNLPSTETVRRIRQKIQEGGLYAADQRIRSTRHHKSLSMQQIAPAATPKYINQTLEQGSLL